MKCLVFLSIAATFAGCQADVDPSKWEYGNPPASEVAHVLELGSLAHDYFSDGSEIAYTVSLDKTYRTFL